MSKLLDAGLTQRIQDGVADGRGAADGAGLADALGAERVARRSVSVRSSSNIGRMWAVGMA